VLPTDYSLTAEVLPTTILAYVTYLTGYHTQVLSEHVKYKMACFKKKGENADLLIHHYNRKSHFIRLSHLTL
jgi:hypothetical protein